MPEMICRGADFKMLLLPTASAVSAISPKSTDSFKSLSVFGIFSADRIFPAFISTFLKSSYVIMDKSIAQCREDHRTFPKAEDCLSEQKSCESRAGWAFHRQARRRARHEEKFLWSKQLVYLFFLSKKLCKISAAAEASCSAFLP